MNNNKSTQRVVLGIYRNRLALESAVGELRAAGFRNSDISALLPSSSTSRDFAHTRSTKAPEGATFGAASGAILGGTLGWLVGIGALTLPGIGALVAAGPIVGALAGAGTVGTVGGIAGALIGMDMPEYEAKRYEGKIQEGGLLLSVHCDNEDWEARAEEIFERTGAFDVSITGEASVPKQDLVEDFPVNPRF